MLVLDEVVNSGLDNRRCNAAYDARASTIRLTYLLRDEYVKVMMIITISNTPAVEDM